MTWIYVKDIFTDIRFIILTIIIFIIIISTIILIKKEIRKGVKNEKNK